MPIRYADLAGGERLAFKDGTPDDVMDRVVAAWVRKDKKDPDWLKRVGARLVEAPERLGRGVAGIGNLLDPRSISRPVGEDLMAILGGVGSVFEPVLAPIGETGRALGTALTPESEVGPEEMGNVPPGIMGMQGEETKGPGPEAGEAFALGAELTAGAVPWTRLATGGRKIPLMSKTITPRGSKLIETVGYEGVRPAQVTDMKFVDFWDEIAGKSLLGQGRVQAKEIGAVRTVERVADDFAAGLGTAVKDPVVRGEMIKDLANLSNKEQRAAGGRLFQLVDEIHGSPAVDMTPVAELAKDLAKQFPEQDIASGFLAIIRRETSPLVKEVDDPINVFGRSLGMDMPSPTTEVTPTLKTFSEANDLRSWVGQWKTPGISPGGDKAVRVGTKIRQAIDEATKEAGKTISPAAYRQLTEARAFWSVESKVFNRRSVRKMLHDGNLAPEAIVDTFLRPGRITEAKALRKMVGGEQSEAWGTIRRAFVEDLFTSAQVPSDVGEMIHGGNLLTRLKRWQEPTVRTILGSEHSNRLHELAEILATLQAKNQAGGGMLIQMKQSGVAVQAGQVLLGAGAAVVNPQVAGVIIFGPWLLARAFTNPRISKLLLEGIKIAPGTVKARRIAGALSNEIDRMQGRPANVKTPSQTPSPSDLESLFFGRDAARLRKAATR